MNFPSLAGLASVTCSSCQKSQSPAWLTLCPSRIAENPASFAAASWAWEWGLKQELSSLLLKVYAVLLIEEGTQI